MTAPPPPAPVRLANTIAVVGCDGSGKSTLTADLHAALARERAAELLYLGQSSGIILDAIRSTPLVGEPLGRFLKARSAKAHSDEDARPAAPDAATALVVHSLSRWRHHKFRRMLDLDRAGTVVITDRYPQTEVPGFWFDGPGLDARVVRAGLPGVLARREQRLYEAMARHVPALVIRLDIDAATAHARKPDHKLRMLQDKVATIPTLHFNHAPLIALSGTSPYPEVLAAALAAARAALAGTAPQP